MLFPAKLPRIATRLAFAGILLCAVPTVGADAPGSRGERVFMRCATCHTIEEGGTGKLGPNLHGLVGRDIASVPGFRYSDTLLAEEGNWTLARLNAFLARPRLATPGTHMPFRGILSPHDREDLLAYLVEVQTGKTPEPDPGLIRDFLNRGDAARGHNLFRPCSVCHNADAAAGHKIGPNLAGVVGRDVATAPGFSYSERLMRRGGTWTPETLNAFIFETKKFDQGSHMAFLALSQLADRADLIAYLREISPGYVPAETDDAVTPDGQ